MKCTRCGSIYPDPVDGWVTCRKCGNAQFVGTKAPAKVKPEVEPEEAKGEGEE